MKFCSAVIALVATTLVNVSAESRNIVTPAVQDATIPFSQLACEECPESDCNKCALGREKTLVASTIDPGHRAIIGFHMPVAGFQVEKCYVQIPALLKHNETAYITVSQAGPGSWSENTVNSGNAPFVGAVLESVEVPAYNNLDSVDVTPACKAAVNGEFSLYFGSIFKRYEFWSRDSGNPAILHITTKDE
ncbi:hypothetical protein COEREDRAFT_83554 [Coemansia reversa NRRL 1564]|uniref:Carbohydrate-binding module family 96 domain-containing protein n=1 Tax=Coemansia reversa (strain ATCC 12441 / NRRL 1564) TaxID=763665 RepID=A0A2G5B3L8_COERN|nr:hypothetical protein COEREDRAFT_83554 [Coemansia reversa NRRL 1564]|eukprot:PIA13307.1 hypothetical protein COEREDRAFT_83554 [Coemansia reversa NRRL 1564]